MAWCWRSTPPIPRNVLILHAIFKFTSTTVDDCRPFGYHRVISNLNIAWRIRTFLGIGGVDRQHHAIYLLRDNDPKMISSLLYKLEDCSRLCHQRPKSISAS